MPSVPWRVESSKIFLKIKKILKIPKMPKSVPKSIQTCFSVIFSKKIYAQCSMEGRVFENFQQKNIFKIPKMPKSVPKSLQTCFEQVFGANFSKNFCPVFHGMSSLRKFSKKIKKVSNFLKCPKLFPKVSKRVLNVFWGKLFEKFSPSFRWNVESSKIFKKNIFKIPKIRKSVPKSIQTCFRVIFSKKFYARCSMQDRVFENFQFFFFQNSKNAQNCSKNVSKHVLNLFWVKFFEFFFAQCSVEGRVFENFQKNIFSKLQKCPKVFPKVSKHVLNMFLGQTFRKILPSFPWNVEFSKIFKNISSKLQKCPKVFPKVSKRVLG